MVRAKRIYILIIRANKLFPFLWLLTCVGVLWRTRNITIVAILIQWDADNWTGIPELSCRVFYKKMKNMFSVFPSSYRNTRESLWKLETLWKHSRLVFPQHFSFSQTSTRVSITHRNTVRVFYFLDSDIVMYSWPLIWFYSCRSWSKTPK